MPLADPSADGEENIHTHPLVIPRSNATRDLQFLYALCGSFASFAF